MKTSFLVVLVIVVGLVIVGAVLVVWLPSGEKPDEVLKRMDAGSSKRVPVPSIPSDVSSISLKPRSAPVYTEWPFDAAEAKRRQKETARILGIPEHLKLDFGSNI